MKKLILSLALITITTTGCAYNAADTATPAPTNLTGMYKASFFGGSVAWKVNDDGTGYACELRNGSSEAPMVRDIVINGTKAYDNFEFDIENVTKDGFTANGFVNFDFKSIKAMPRVCRQFE
jgi:hypothetical protein